MGLPGSQGHEGKGHDPALWDKPHPWGRAAWPNPLSLSLPRTLTPRPKGFPVPADPRSRASRWATLPPPPQEATQLEVQGLPGSRRRQGAEAEALEEVGSPSPATLRCRKAGVSETSSWPGELPVGQVAGGQRPGPSCPSSGWSSAGWPGPRQAQAGIWGSLMPCRWPAISAGRSLVAAPGWTCQPRSLRGPARGSPSEGSGQHQLCLGGPTLAWPVVPPLLESQALAPCL